MRKKSISYLADSIFWYIVYLLPVLCYLGTFISHNTTIQTSLPEFFGYFGVTGLTDIVTDTLTKLFGVDGILPLYGASVGIPIFSWYVSMMIIHLAVDFLLFIPRLCHSWMDKFCSGDK